MQAARITDASHARTSIIGATSIRNVELRSIMLGDMSEKPFARRYVATKDQAKSITRAYATI